MAKAKTKVEIAIPAEYKRLLLQALKERGIKINKHNIDGISSTEVVVKNIMRRYLVGYLNDVADYHPQEIEMDLEEVEEVNETIQRLEKEGFLTIPITDSAAWT